MNLEQRINRIIGQLRGIQRMVSVGRDCNEVLQQISAVKKAIDGLSKEIVVGDISKYLAKDGDTKKVEKMLERAINL
jgi:DNA-binding FrmR family transcriptional regulator